MNILEKIRTYEGFKSMTLSKRIVFGILAVLVGIVTIPAAIFAVLFMYIGVFIGFCAWGFVLGLKISDLFTEKYKDQLK